VFVLLALTAVVEPWLQALWREPSFSSQGYWPPANESGSQERHVVINVIHSELGEACLDGCCDKLSPDDVSAS
jgi:hypothetical protein